MMREMKSVPILPGERADDLQRDGMFVLQRPDAFRFGADSVLLAAFAAQGRVGSVRAADLGSGSGVLPLLVCGRVPGARFDAVEIDPAAADRAARGVRISGLEGRIAVHAVPLEAAPKLLGCGRYDLVVSNPPYGEPNGQQAGALRDAAVREGTTDIAAVCRSASKLLRNGGAFCVCFPARRLAALFAALSAERLEPKRLQPVYPAPNREAKLVLVEAVRNAKPGMRVLEAMGFTGETFFAGEGFFAGEPFL